MDIERTENEILIRVPKTTDLGGVERLLEYIRFREIASKSKASQEEIDEVAADSKKEWWKENKHRFIK